MTDNKEKIFCYKSLRPEHCIEIIKLLIILLGGIWVYYNLDLSRFEKEMEYQERQHDFEMMRAFLDVINSDNLDQRKDALEFISNYLESSNAASIKQWIDAKVKNLNSINIQLEKTRKDLLEKTNILSETNSTETNREIENLKQKIEILERKLKITVGPSTSTSTSTSGYPTSTSTSTSSGVYK